MSQQSNFVKTIDIIAKLCKQQQTNHYSTHKVLDIIEDTDMATVAADNPEIAESYGVSNADLVAARDAIQAITDLLESNNGAHRKAINKLASISNS